jgi:hypothetical protein
MNPTSTFMHYVNQADDHKQAASYFRNHGDEAKATYHEQQAQTFQEKAWEAWWK